VAEVAVALGIKEGAVRSRIKRGTLPTVREGGNVYVVLGGSTSEANQSAHVSEPPDEPPDQSELVESLQDQVAYLRELLESEREAGRRKDHLLAAALERIPAIEPPAEKPSEPQGRSEGASEDVSGGEEAPPRDAEEPRRRRTWWRRLLDVE
jgi:hypothetical protein